MFLEYLWGFSHRCNEQNRQVPTFMELSILVQICLLLAVCGLDHTASVSGTVCPPVHTKGFHLSFLLFSSAVFSTFTCCLGQVFIFPQFKILSNGKKIARMPFFK